ncbi:MAG: GYD domain-containing protein [Alphaproteobacteria bacterium]|nr:GYD domain-containing protein [Alphaproteobacteria bacterium]
MALKYLLLGQLSPQSPAGWKSRLKKATAKFKQLGITFEVMYYVQGEFDSMAIVEAPSAEAMVAASVWYAQQGYGKFRTHPVISADAMAKALAKV